MTLDQYQPCPCGSGKKIKFCCSKDILHDLDRIQRMLQGDQKLAAREKIVASLEKYPDRPSLLMMKADSDLQAGEVDKARETIKRLTEVDPSNPSVTAMLALLSGAHEGNISAAIHWLQESFNRTDGEVTAAVYEAILVIASLLQRVGYVAAAKGHLQLALALSDTKDDRSARALMQLNHSRQIPMVLREPLSLKSCPQDVTWRIEFEVTMREIFRGRWRRGADQLAMMAIRILDEPSILFNQGVVCAWLGDNQKAIKAFQDFAGIRGVSAEDRVHALALVQYLDTDPERTAVERIDRVYEIQDLDAVMEKCLASDHLTSLPIDPSARPDDETPLPRAMFEYTDRPQSKDTKDLQIDDISELLGVLLLFGKETDRPARLVISTTKPLANQVTQYCAELAELELGEPVSDEVTGKMPWMVAEVFRQWRIPNSLPIDERRRLESGLRERAITQNWPEIPSPRLNGKTPREAAKEKSLVPEVLAVLLNLQLMAQDNHWHIDFEKLREDLGLPQLEPVDIEHADFDRLPIHRLSTVDIKSLDDDQLLTVYRRAYAVMAIYPLRTIAMEVIGRPTLDGKIDKVEAYDILSDVAFNTEESLEYLDKARKLATKEGESPAAWLIDELELRLLRGEGDKFVQLLKEIQTRYIKEPGIAPALVETLSRYGLMTPDGRVMLPASAAEAATRETVPAESNAPAASGVWTPDSGTSSAAEPSGEEKSESKLWIPGMD